MAQSSTTDSTHKRDGPDIEEQLRGLRDDLKTLVDSVASLAADQSDAVKETVRDKIDETTDGARRVAGQARRQVNDVHDKVNGMIEAHPSTSVLVAFGVGMILGVCSRR